jgi:hypothetical protein
MAFNTWHEDIDITFPANYKATLKMLSEQGEIYSDFQVDLQNQRRKVDDKRSRDGKYRISFQKYINGTINGGGPEVQLRNYHGNIYIRKK